MILVLKKITCIIAVFVFAFMLVVSAAEDFLIYGKQTEEVSKVLGLKTQELDKYCTDNNVTYFAVNANNTKQVKRTEISDEFAQKVVDLSAWDDSKVLQLSSSLSGFEGAKGEVINKGDYKFLKVELQSEDSGGDYVLTQYTTVKNKERIVLTFFTSPGEDYGYIGRDSDLAQLDMQKAISDMQKDSILQQYQYFVGSSQNIVTDKIFDEGIVVPKFDM